MRPTKRTPGPSVTDIRPLVEADLEALRRPSAGVRLKTIRESHHKIARLLASGLPLYEVAEQTGYSYIRIHMLSKDPSIVELVAHYRNMLTEDWRDEQSTFQTLAMRNMVAAERQISDKLDAADEAGELLPTRELLAISSDRMDRFGYGKKNMNVNVNVDFAAKLEAAIARTRKVAAE